MKQRSKSNVSTYHSHRAYNDKATLIRNTSFPTIDANRLGNISHACRQQMKKRNKKIQLKRAQSAKLLSKWTIESPISKQNKVSKNNLSRCQYSRELLNWHKKNEWECNDQNEVKLKHLAKKKVRKLWKKRNIPQQNDDAATIPAYNKIISSKLKIKTLSPRKSLKKLSKKGIKSKKNKQHSKIQPLKPGPIYRKLSIYSSNTNNRNLVKQKDQIIVDIETRLRTHRPTVLLWPSKYYLHCQKQREHDVVIDKKNNKCIEFQNTFTNSYLFNSQKRTCTMKYIPKLYDVNVSVHEQSIGSKKWRAVFDVNSHHFVNGVVPFEVCVKLLKNPSSNDKEFGANMSTDHSYVVLKGSKRTRRRKKKCVKKAKTMHKTNKRERPKTRTRRLSSYIKQNRDKYRKEYQFESVTQRNLASEYEDLKGSINDIQQLLYQHDKQQAEILKNYNRESMIKNERKKEILS